MSYYNYPSTPFFSDPFFSDPFFEDFNTNGQPQNPLARRLRSFFPASKWTDFDREFDQFMNRMWGTTGEQNKQITEEKNANTNSGECESCECANKNCCKDESSAMVPGPSELKRDSSRFLNLWKGLGTATDEMTLQMNESPDKTEYNLVASVPGFNKDNLSVKCSNGQITVSGKLEEERQDKEKGRYSKSSHWVSRSVTLPRDADEKAIEARFNEGKLEIAIKKDKKVHEKQERSNIMIQ